MYTLSIYFSNAWSLLVNNPLFQIEAMAICVCIFLALRPTFQLKKLKERLLEVETTMATQKDMLKDSITALESADVSLKEKSDKIKGYVNVLLASVASLTTQVEELEILANIDLSQEIARIDAVTADITAVAAELDAASTPAPPAP